MVAHLRARLDVPLYTGFPFGHCPEKLALPVGGRATITVRDGAAQLVLSDYGSRS
jgi:muramoyltetrapeptide carboxypeptidase